MEKFIIDALIEIPQGSQNKYEVDKKTNQIRLDRPLYSAMLYPAEYGYIENTLARDGDPLDVLVFTSFPTVPGCVVQARIIGVLEMYDSGDEDVKLIGVCNNDPRFAHVQSLSDITPHILIEVRSFFDTYKALQNKEVITKEWHGIDKAIEYYNDSIQRYKKSMK